MLSLSGIRRDFSRCLLLCDTLRNKKNNHAGFVVLATQIQIEGGGDTIQKKYTKNGHIRPDSSYEFKQLFSTAATNFM